MRAALNRWCAWAPGIEAEADWLRWAAAPAELTGRGTPDLSFVPALQRRRLDPLARSMLHVAARCAGDALASLPSVFASRHGPIDTTVALLVDLAVGTALSPTRFSHSVHNTQHGLFSIWARNTEPACTVSARSETFVSGFVEALALAHRARADRVLLVVGDIALPEPFDGWQEEPHGGYALALLLEPDGAGPAVSLSATEAPSRPCGWPPALEFLRWWIREEPSLRIAGTRRSWEWTREDAG
ncbi:MAG: beta-ketoacyl synthase chain length factor [Deltaproteobacteria bacterium]|nr:beta-ketoacyl synthase chain length factor [Deltaproteobacteria bacterium]